MMERRDYKLGTHYKSALRKIPVPGKIHFHFDLFTGELQREEMIYPLKSRDFS